MHGESDERPFSFFYTEEKPSYKCYSMKKSESVHRSIMSSSLWPHGLGPSRCLCPWNFPGKNTEVGYHSLHQGIFPTKGSNPGLLQCRQILYCLSHLPGYSMRSMLPIIYFLEKLPQLHTTNIFSVIKWGKPYKFCIEISLNFGEGNGSPSSIHAWEVPWTEEPDGPQSMRLQEDDATYAKTTTTSLNLQWLYILIYPS